MERSRRNIRIAYILSFISELYFPISIWLFYYLRHLTFTEVGVLTTIKLTAAILLEVPTGAFADKYGRRSAVILSFGLYGAAMLMTTQATVLWMFAAIDVIKALGSAFFSGSMEALVYDSLKEEGQEKEYDKVAANLESISWIGLFLSSIMGGYLYYYSPQSPYLIQGIMYMAAAIIGMKLVEPKFDSVKYNFGESLRLNLSGFSQLFANIKTAQTSLVFITLGAGYFFASEWLGMSQILEYGVDSRGAGVIFGVGYIISALASQAYPRLRKKFGGRRLLITTSIILLTSFLMARWVGVGIGIMLIVARISSSTTFRNVRSSIINGLIESKTRATTLSTLILLSQLPMALFAYFMGQYIDTYSPNSFAFLLGIVIVTLLVMQTVFFELRNKNKLGV